MSNNRKNRPVPTGRLERLFGLGAMAGSIGARVAYSGARQLLSGRPPSLGELLLAPANALRVAEQLSHMRGAAMKLGQNRDESKDFAAWLVQTPGPTCTSANNAGRSDADG